MNKLPQTTLISTILATSSFAGDTHEAINSTFYGGTTLEGNTEIKEGHTLTLVKEKNEFVINHGTISGALNSENGAILYNMYSPEQIITNAEVIKEEAKKLLCEVDITDVFSVGKRGSVAETVKRGEDVKIRDYFLLSTLIYLKDIE